MKYCSYCGKQIRNRRWYVLAVDAPQREVSRHRGQPTSVPTCRMLWGDIIKLRVLIFNVRFDKLWLTDMLMYQEK